MSAGGLGFWWKYRDFDRDADVVSSKLAAYVEELSKIDRHYADFYKYIDKMRSKGVLTKRLQKDGFVTSLIYVWDDKADIILYSGSFRYGDDLPDLSGRIDLGLDGFLENKPHLVKEIFELSIGYWNADEAGRYTVNPDWEFQYRWRRNGITNETLPNILLGERWTDCREIWEGKLYMY